MSQPELLAWERQTGEPDDAWAAFQRYRDMAAPRNMRYAAVVSQAKILSWANEWRWQERATAYDRHTDALRRAEREEMLRQDAQERTAKDIATLRGAEELLDNELKKMLAESHASEMSLAKVSDLTKLLDKVITLRRLVHGESTENVSVSTEFDLSNLSIDELRKWRELQAKVTKE